MNVDSPSGNPSGKRAALPGWAAWVLRELRLSWLTVLVLLILVFYGLRAGWTAPRQWSDGLFIAGVIQLIIASITVLSPPGEALDASTVRYVANGSISDTRKELLLDTLRRRGFGIRALAGAALTMLLAEVVLWV